MLCIKGDYQTGSYAPESMIEKNAPRLILPPPKRDMLLQSHDSCFRQGQESMLSGLAIPIKQAIPPELFSWQMAVLVGKLCVALPVSLWRW